MIFFMLSFIFILIKFSVLTPVDTLNLAVGCTPSYAFTHGEISPSPPSSPSPMYPPPLQGLQNLAEFGQIRPNSSLKNKIYP